MQPSSGARCLTFGRTGPFVYFHSSWLRTAKALTRLRECAGSPEPSLNAYVISTIISWAGSINLIISHLSPLTFEVIGAPKMTLQQYISILPCLPLHSGSLQTPFPSIPWCYLPISSFVILSFLLLSLSLVELSSPCQRNLRCGHSIWVFVSLLGLGDHHALQLHSWFCCEPPPSSHILCRKCSEVSYSISSQGLESFSRFLLSRSSSHRHKGR